MTSFVPLIKNLIVYVLPLYLIHLYLKTAYGVGSGTIIAWWSKNWGKLEGSGIPHLEVER